MKIKTLGLIALGIVFLSLSLTAQARIRDEFFGLDNFGGLSPAFEKLANPDKFSQSGINPKFEELGNIKPELDKFGSVDNPMNKVTLKPSFERLATGTVGFKDSTSAGLERLAQVSTGISGEFKPSFERFTTLNPAMQGELKPAFTRIASLSTALTGEFNPSFAKLGQLSPALSGEVNPSFAKLTTVSPALAGELNPSFAKLGNLNVETTIYLKPAFTRLAALNPAFSGSLNPTFAKLANLSPAFSGSLSPAFSKLATLNPAFSGSLDPAFDKLSTLNPQFAAKVNPNLERLTFDMRKAPSLEALEQATQPLNLYAVPENIQLKIPQVAPRGNVALDQFFGGTGSLYRLSLSPSELKGLSTQDATELLGQEIYLLQPELMKSTSPSAANTSTAPQYISLISLLGVEKAN